MLASSAVEINMKIRALKTGEEEPGRPEGNFSECEELVIRNPFVCAGCCLL